MAESRSSARSAEKSMQDTIDKINGQGFAGVEVDQTPNANYTVAGVTAGKPTPETTGE